MTLVRARRTHRSEYPEPVGRYARIDAVAIALNGHQLAVLEFDDSSIMDSITVYELASGLIRNQFHGHRNLINDMAFTPDGSKLISVSVDLTGLVWDVAPFKPLGPVAKSTRYLEERRPEDLLLIGWPAGLSGYGEIDCRSRRSFDRAESELEANLSCGRCRAGTRQNHRAPTA